MYICEINIIILICRKLVSVGPVKEKIKLHSPNLVFDQFSISFHYYDYYYHYYYFDGKSNTISQQGNWGGFFCRLLAPKASKERQQQLDNAK